MPAETPNDPIVTSIKKIEVDGNFFDLDASYLGGRSADEWEDLIDAHLDVQGPFVDSHNPASITIVPYTTTTLYRKGPQQTSTAMVAGATYKNGIYLFDQTSSDSPHKEYVVIGSGTTVDPYLWSYIGTSETNLQNYVKKGTYTTGSSGSGTTGSGGTLTAVATSTVDGYDATGHIGADITTNSAGGVTVQGSNFSFTGTEKQIGDGSVKIDYHTFTPTGTITGYQDVTAHNHTVTAPTTSVLTNASVSITGTARVIKEDGLDSDDNFLAAVGTPTLTTVVTGVTTGTTSVLTGVKATGTATVLTGVTYTTTNVFNGATVDANGVLSFVTTPVAKSASGNGTASAVTGVGANGTASAVTSVTKTTTSAICGVSSVTTQVALTSVRDKGGTSVMTSATLVNTTTPAVTSVSLTSAGAVTIYGSSFGFAGDEEELSHTQENAHGEDLDELTVKNPKFTPTGTIGGSQTINGHTHSISASTAEVISVTIPKHNHTVTVDGHTHSIGNHTHSITFS